MGDPSTHHWSLRGVLSTRSRRAEGAVAPSGSLNRWPKGGPPLDMPAGSSGPESVPGSGCTCRHGWRAKHLPSVSTFTLAGCSCLWTPWISDSGHGWQRVAPSLAGSNRPGPADRVCRCGDVGSPLLLLLYLDKFTKNERTILEKH